MGGLLLRLIQKHMTLAKGVALLLVAVGIGVNGYGVWYLGVGLPDWGMVSDLLVVTLPYWLVMALILLADGPPKLLWIIIGLLVIMNVLGGIGLDYIFEFSFEYPRTRYYPGKIVTSIFSIMIESFSLVIMMMMAYGGQTICALLGLGTTAWFKFRTSKSL